MRRLNFRQDRERGGISVIVALLMVVLLGFTAIAVDVGMLYSEKAQLQNGADAAALLVAHKCAKNESHADCTTTSAAASILNGNALDGRSNLKSLALDLTKDTVTVTAGAQEQGADENKVSLFFANALGIASAEVNASSTVKWGTPSKGPAILPLAIAYCKLDIPAAGTTGAEQVLNQSVNGCGGIPGGFGWIQGTVTATTCAVTVTAGSSTNSGIWFTSDPGASPPAVCTAADFSQMNDQTVLLPLYDVATGAGATGQYYIKGFAAFHITGYHFPSISWTTGGNLPNKAIRGYFVKFVSLSEAFELGSAPDYGTSVVRLTQ